MEKLNLKKGLFGYTESSVLEYIKTISCELKLRIDKLSEENKTLLEKHSQLEAESNSAKSEANKLSDEINSLSEENNRLKSDKAELEKQIELLTAKLSEADGEKLDYEKGQNDLADVMLEAKRFANNLKKQSEDEYKRQKAENEEKINCEKQRIEKYVSEIDSLCGTLHKVCDNFGKDLENKKTDLSSILSKLNNIDIKHKLS